MPTYTVKSGSGPRGVLYWVITFGPEGQEYPVTQETKSLAQADSWCVALRRAAQVNAERRAVAKGKRR